MLQQVLLSSHLAAASAANPGGREEDVAGLFFGEESLDRGLAGEVELGVGAGDEILVAPVAQVAHEGGADQAAMAGDVDLGALVHGFTRGSPWSCSRASLPVRRVRRP